MNAKRVSQAVVRKRLTAEWESALESALGMKPSEARVFVQKMFDPQQAGAIGGEESTQLRAALTVAVANFGMSGLRKGWSKIKTEDDLEKAIASIRKTSLRVPTAVRAAMKEVSTSLPRRGGRGRQPKLDPEQSRLACNQISSFHREKCSVKEAIEKTAQMSEKLFGYSVGTRTLQKAWSNRDKFTNKA